MALGTAYLISGVTAVFLAGMMVTSGFPIPSDATPASTGPTGAYEERAHDVDAHESAHPNLLTPVGFDLLMPPDLRHEPPFPPETGKRPSLDEAKSFHRKYSRFIAKGDAGIESLRAEGHLQGDGTPERPYVLEKFYVDGELSLTSLHKPLIVRDGYVGGQFKLNYVGEQVYVHHVYAKDLRVNENVKRNGTNTGGLFHDNHFAFVGQIRHFTGEFRDNKIGPRPGDAISESLGDSGVVKVANEVVFNFDGFHRADVHHNEFLGQVDIKLHGHNHGDCFVCPVHDHSNPTDVPDKVHDGPAPDRGFRSRHSVRYASLAFHDNTITIPTGPALRYNDQNHAGDDRTANSEPNEYLADPHVHFQDITIQANRLQGGGLQVDVFNAPDDRHVAQNLGILRAWDNDIRVDYEPPSATGGPRQAFGIQVRKADGLQLSLRDNEIRFRELDPSRPGDALLRAAAPKMELRGIQLEHIDASNLTIESTLVESARYGAFAQTLTPSTYWTLRRNTFATDEAWRGQNVANPPKEE